jgi:protein-L-isoaspartate(D-aspartate) O-methyltransferase
MSFEEVREEMVRSQLAGRGLSNERVLAAFRAVPREAFVPEKLHKLAYRDAPLPIGEDQTISQPYVVAVTLDALGLRGGERVLEIGTGSGYAAAVLGRAAREVYTVERLGGLAEAARERLALLGYENVHVLHGDGTLGWPAHAPYDAIAVAAGGPEVPPALRAQLAIGGRMIIPIGEDEGAQTLMRITRTGSDAYEQEALLQVRFVPLIGEQGWAPEPEDAEEHRVLHVPPRKTVAGEHASIAHLVRETAAPISSLSGLGTGVIEGLLERVGDARLVLLGEATHGTSEFYRARAELTKALIQRRGFDFVAVEADWPDAARIDDYVLGDGHHSRVPLTPFARFPSWMWRNHEVQDFVAWLRDHNAGTLARARGVGFHGLDLYSLYSSIAAVLGYLDEVDPESAHVARARYGTLTPWQKDPAAYGRAVLDGHYASSEAAVVAMLRDLLEHRLDFAQKDGERFFDAAQNARVVADAERYYRAMYYGSATAWNLRDAHMFDTLQALLSFYGPESRGVVWEHNSHVGDASATEMSERGELNVGQLCRAKHDGHVYVVGFGTDHGTVAAAADWGAPMERMRVRPSHPESYERLFHDSGVPAFSLALREPRRPEVPRELASPRLERAIGVVYRPDTELASHYFYASLPHQFDELIWFDETSAVSAFGPPARVGGELPETYPFGL